MRRTRRFIAVLLVILTVALGLVFAGCEREKYPPVERETEKKPLPALEIEVTSESGNLVVLKTSYGYVRYPKAFSDFITVEAVNYDGSSELQFFADLGGKKVPIYTIHYNIDAGIPCGRFRVAAVTDEVGVSVTFHEIPENISENWVSTFNATQETFNDVLASLADDPRFTSAE